MKESSIKSIRNGIIASVIAGVILLLIPAIRDFVLAGLSLLLSGLLWCWQALISDYSAPGWLCLIILIFSIIGIVRVYLAILGDRTIHEYDSYVEDFLYGAKWRWQWKGNQISDLWCFCPSCDATLVYDDSSCRNIYADVKKTDFICENCDRNVASVKGGNMDYAIHAAKREIQRRIRTGVYKKN